MIPYIDAKLKLWGEWRVRSEMGQRGNLKSSLGAWQTAAVSSSRSLLSYVPIDDLEACELDRIVAALEETLKTLLLEMYYYTNPTEDKLKRLGCSERTLYYRLHVAHVKVMEALQDAA